MTNLLLLGVGRVSFSALGSGFGFLDFARVGFRVKEIWFGSSSGQIFLHFSVNFGCIWQKISNISQKKVLRVTRVLEKVARVGSGWPKRPRVGSNLGSGFDPTHPYKCVVIKNFKNPMCLVMKGGTRHNF